MKTWMKVVLGIIAALVLLVGLVFWLTGDAAKAGDDFFAAVQNDDIDAAYELLSEDFQAGTSKEELVSYLAANALDKVEDTSWSSRSITGGSATLEGTATTASGGKIPLNLRLVQTENGWKINAIIKDRAGFQTRSEEEKSLPVPSDPELLALVRSSMANFVDGMNAPTMTGFRKSFSQTFQRQFSLAELETAFKKFKANDELEVFKTLKPVVQNGTKITDEGVLQVKGYYNTRPTRMTFEQGYIYEGTGWKLLEFNVEAVDVGG
ncbi:DUF4864 domain-containing protein [Parasphingorhabdus sp.]|uniref:DUF4864 domain-containing protein n=1 Tax=Parasphingorhabdus sp. TaxID=2709688 RepID=UPI003C77242E